jgi:hypothetical protein
LGRVILAHHSFLLEKVLEIRRIRQGVRSWVALGNFWIRL